jgi:hypothetical protein
VLERLQELAGFPLDLADVRRASRLLDEQIERIVQGKPELREHVKNLERLHASGPDAPAAPARRPVPPQSPEDNVINIDLFLRKNHDPDRSA